MNELNRRRFLTGAGLVGAAAVLGACDSSSSPPEGDGGNPTGGSSGPAMEWWDQFNPLQDLHRSVFKEFTADGHPEVKYTVYNPNEQGEALQLAKQSDQLPDVFTLAGVGVPPSVLASTGWFAPLASPDAIQSALPEGSIVPGLHIFDDKLYSFPIFTFRQYETLVWFNRGQVEKADLDPDDPPTSWDDFRKAAQAVQKSGTSGVLLPLAFPERMQTFVFELAQTAGFAGSRTGATDGVDLTTGEYRFHDDAFVDAIDFLMSFKKDGSLFPASSSLDARDGRARWAGGSSAYFMDGPWNAGVLAGDFEPFLEQLGVGPIPTPGGDAPVLTRPPTGGTFWIAGKSDQVDEASALLELFAGDEYQRGLAGAMDQPPIDSSIVTDSDAHDTYKQAISMFTDQVFLGPTPLGRNPKVAEVQAQMKPIEPNLGAIVQGAFSGQIGDLRAALKKLSDATEKERQAAIAKVGGVSTDDWVFSDWERGTDYTTKSTE